MKRIILIGLAIIMILMVSCKKNEEDEMNYDNLDKTLIERVGDSFSAMIKALNDKDYDKYISYYRISEEEKNLIIEIHKSSSNDFKQEYSIYNVLAFENEDGTISATVVIDNKSTSIANKVVSKLREYTYYTLIEENGKFYIESYEIGMTQTLDW